MQGNRFEALEIKLSLGFPERVLSIMNGWAYESLFVSKYRTDLHPDIKKSFKELSVLSEFLDTLTFITKSNLNLKEAFTDKTERTLPLLRSTTLPFKTKPFLDKRGRKDARRF